MTRSRGQTLRGFFFLGLVLIVIGVAWKLAAPRIHSFSFLSGWLLLGVMLILACYNLRKRVPFLPVGTSEGWLQVHIYLGWASFGFLALHIGFRLPDGNFERTLGVLYLLVALSGVGGLFLSRLLPNRMTTRGGEVLFERIPDVRRHLAAKAQALALDSVQSSGATTLAEFYASKLKDFFECQPPLLRHMVGDRRALYTMLGELKDLNRFVAREERGALEKIAELVQQKDTLDFQYVSQLMLKLWLFIHLPFTFALLLFTLVHIVLVYAFSGGRS